MTDLAQVLGQLFERERSRRLEAVPLAADFLGAGEQMTTGRVAASQQLGALPFTREYNEFLRQTEELGIPLEVALQLITKSNEYYEPSYQPSRWEKYVQPLIQTGLGIKNEL